MVIYQTTDCAAPRWPGTGPLSNNTVDPTGNKMFQVCIKYAGIMMSPGHIYSDQGSIYEVMLIAYRSEF